MIGWHAFKFRANQVLPKPHWKTSQPNNHFTRRNMLMGLWPWCNGCTTTPDMSLNVGTLIALLLLLEEKEEWEEDHAEAQNARRRERWARMSEGERRRRTQNIPRPCLTKPKDSSWVQMHRSKHDRGMITITGHDHSNFESLHAQFQPLFASHTPFLEDESIRPLTTDEIARCGRPHSVTSRACLALTLFWTWTKAQEFCLGVMLWVGWFSSQCVAAIWKTNSAQSIALSWRLQNQDAATSNKYPALTTVACMGDRLKIPPQKAGDVFVQNQLHNEWRHNHCITNLFVFALMA